MRPLARVLNITGLANPPWRMPRYVMPATADILRRELEDAFKGRAHLYRVMFDVLTERLGAAEAEAVLAEVCERRGREVAPLLFKEVPADPQAIARRFLAVSPDGGDLYPHEASGTPDSFTIAVHSCPLKQAWMEAGLPADDIARLCRIAGAFDRGLFEAAGVGFENSTWSEERGGGCCRITLLSR
jgi:L-2-amino-thiazoline-4-carboxylic acid hydrolase